jgi:HAD superfamily hydrolase (TIGR01490 family)
VRGAREVKEVNEVHEVKEKRSRVAAFFDLDGTLVPLPSLEKRLFWVLRYRRAIPAQNYFLWLREAMRLVPYGIGAVLQPNKMYLRGVQILDERDEAERGASSWHKDGYQAKGQASDLPSKRARRNPRLPVPTFFAQAIETVAWHAKQWHEIVLVSGTLQPLAERTARAMEAELAAHGITATIRVLATRLEEAGGRWTGRVLGEAMYGEAKARAAKRFAEEVKLDLGRCYAYGDSLNDRWLMETVGQPTAVNPSNDLASIARTRGWPILNWKEKENLTQRRRVHRETSEKKEQSARLYDVAIIAHGEQRNCRMEVRPENIG